jgi:uncharacterized protein YaaR (DUF327 family)
MRASHSHVKTASTQYPVQKKKPSTEPNHKPSEETKSAPTTPSTGFDLTRLNLDIQTAKHSISAYLEATITEKTTLAETLKINDAFSTAMKTLYEEIQHKLKDSGQADSNNDILTVARALFSSLYVSEPLPEEHTLTYLDRLLSWKYPPQDDEDNIFERLQAAFCKAIILSQDPLNQTQKRWLKQKVYALINGSIDEKTFTLIAYHFYMQVEDRLRAQNKPHGPDTMPCDLMDAWEDVLPPEHCSNEKFEKIKKQLRTFTGAVSGSQASRTRDVTCQAAGALLEHLSTSLLPLTRQNRLTAEARLAAIRNISTITPPDEKKGDSNDPQDEKPIFSEQMAGKLSRIFNELSIDGVSEVMGMFLNVGMGMTMKASYTDQFTHDLQTLKTRYSPSQQNQKKQEKLYKAAQTRVRKQLSTILDQPSETYMAQSFKIIHYVIVDYFKERLLPWLQKNICSEGVQFHELSSEQQMAIDTMLLSSFLLNVNLTISLLGNDFEYDPAKKAHFTMTSSFMQSLTQDTQQLKNLLYDQKAADTHPAFKYYQAKRTQWQNNVKGFLSSNDGLDGALTLLGVQPRIPAFLSMVYKAIHAMEPNDYPNTPQNTQPMNAYRDMMLGQLRSLFSFMAAQKNEAHVYLPLLVFKTISPDLIRAPALYQRILRMAFSHSQYVCIGAGDYYRVCPMTIDLDYPELLKETSTHNDTRTQPHPLRVLLLSLLLTNSGPLPAQATSTNEVTNHILNIIHAYCDESTKEESKEDTDTDTVFNPFEDSTPPKTCVIDLELELARIYQQQPFSNLFIQITMGYLENVTISLSTTRSADYSSLKHEISDQLLLHIFETLPPCLALSKDANYHLSTDLLLAYRKFNGDFTTRSRSSQTTLQTVNNPPFTKKMIGFRPDSYYFIESFKKFLRTLSFDNFIPFIEDILQSTPNVHPNIVTELTAAILEKATQQFSRARNNTTLTNDYNNIVRLLMEGFDYLNSPKTLHLTHKLQEASKRVSEGFSNAEERINGAARQRLMPPPGPGDSNASNTHAHTTVLPHNPGN